MVFEAIFNIPYTAYKFQKILKTQTIKGQFIEKNNLSN